MQRDAFSQGSSVWPSNVVMARWMVTTGAVSEMLESVRVSRAVSPQVRAVVPVCSSMRAAASFSVSKIDITPSERESWPQEIACWDLKIRMACSAWMDSKRLVSHNKTGPGRWHIARHAPHRCEARRHNALKFGKAGAEVPHRAPPPVKNRYHSAAPCKPFPNI